MRPITARQQRYLDAIVEHWHRHGCYPTLRELAAAVGVSSTNGVSEILDRLEAAGRVRLRVGRARHIVPLSSDGRPLPVAPAPRWPDGPVSVVAVSDRGGAPVRLTLERGRLTVERSAEPAEVFVWNVTALAAARVKPVLVGERDGKREWTAEARRAAPAVPLVAKELPDGRREWSEALCDCDLRDRQWDPFRVGNRWARAIENARHEVERLKTKEAELKREIDRLYRQRRKARSEEG